MIKGFNRNALRNDHDALTAESQTMETTAAARRAARQAGLSLNTWINQVVSEKAAMLGLDEDDLDEDERMDAIVEKLTRLDLRAGRRMPARDTRRAFMLDDEPMPRAPALGRVIERLESIESRLGRGQPQNDTVLESALTRIEQRLNALDTAPSRPAAPVAAPAPATPKDMFATIEAKLQALNASLDRSTAARPAPQPVAHQSLAQQPVAPLPVAPQAPFAQPHPLDRPAASALDERFFKEAFERETRAFDGLHAEIAKLAEQMQELRRPQPDQGMANLQRDLAAMAKILAEMAPRHSLTSLESRLDTLIDSLNQPRSDGAGGSAIAAPLGEMRAELRRMVAEMDPRASLGAIEAEVRQLARKVSELETAGFDPSAFTDLQAQTSEMRQLLHALLSRPQSSEMLEQQVGLLADKIEQMTRAASPASARGEDFAAAIEQIRALVDHRLASPNIEALERQVQALSQRIDSALAEPATPHIMQAPAIDTSGLESMLHQLAHKIDSARQPSADANAFAALEDQMSRIAAKFEVAETNNQHFRSLQNSITDLFAHLEETREVATRAAQAATRAASQRPEAAAEGAAPQVSALSQDMTQLLRAQEAADRRATQTMSAVHATLEKIVGRLASLEDEVVEVRRQPAAARPAFAPAPEAAMPAPASSHTPAVAPAAPSFTTTAPVLQPSAGLSMAPSSQPRMQREEPIDAAPVAPSVVANRAEPTVNFESGSDFLLEPGKGFTPPRRQAAVEVSASAPPVAAPVVAAAPAPAAPKLAGEEAPANKAEFIAAARRAAQAAAVAAQNQLEDARAGASKPGSKMAAAMNPAGMVERIRAFAEERKRPLLLGLAGVMVAMLGVQVYGALSGDSEPAMPKAPVAKTEKAPAPQAEAKSTDAKPVEAKTVETKPVEAKPAESKPVESKPVETKPVEVKPVETKPVEAKAPQQPAPQMPAPAPQNAAPTGKPPGLTPVAPAVQPPPFAPMSTPNHPAPPSAVPPAVRQGNPLALPPGPKAKLESGQSSFYALNDAVPAGGFRQNQPVTQQGFGLSKTGPMVAARKIDMTPLGATAPQPDPVAADDVVPSPTVQQPPVKQEMPQAVTQPTIPDAQKPLDLNQPQPKPADSATQLPPLAAPAPMAIAPKLPNPAISVPGTPGTTAPMDTAFQPASPGLKAAANGGNAAAQYELATKYADGRGEQRDFKAAAALFEKAAAQNLAPAQYRLGALYEKGLGVPRDLEQAKTLYKKAAELGNPRAMHNLAVLIAEGSDGHPDYANAVIWFKKAAEYGVRDSQFNLGILSARGLGMNADLAQAYVWFAVAAAQGDEDAAKKRDDVGLRLDAMALENAKNSATTFAAKKPDSAAVDVVAPPGGWDTPAPKVENRRLPPPVAGVKAKIT